MLEHREPSESDAQESRRHTRILPRVGSSATIENFPRRRNPVCVHPTYAARRQAARIAAAVALAMTMLSSIPARAQTAAVTRAPIVTDRPDFTESDVVVPQGMLQIETGFTVEQGKGSRALGLPEALLRCGAAQKFEWRLGLPDFNRARADGQTTRGLGDTYLGAKFQIGPTRQGLGISLIPAIFVPTGGRDFGSGSVNPELKLCLARDLSARWTVAGMLYASWPTEDKRRNPTLQNTVSFGYAFTDRFSMFNEYAGTFARRGAAEHVLHSGFAYLLSDDRQLDLHFGFGLSSAAPGSFFAAGYSVRF